ncbi:MAG: ATP-binding protein [Ignavibacteriaceae bacterium]|nr:ATP-binding protein [Ignavibacteriaceae bacterium]
MNTETITESHGNPLSLLSVETAAKLFSAVFDSSPDAIFIIDGKNSEIIRFNKKAEEMFDLHLRDPDTPLFPRMLHKNGVTDEIQQEYLETMKSGRPWIKTFLFRSLGGRDFWGSLVLLKNPLLGEDLEMSRVTDITEEKKILYELEGLTTELTEQNMMKNKFISVLAHDLRSPFHPLLNWTEILISEYDDLSENERREITGKVQGSVRKLYNLLESLLSWSRASSGNISYNPQPLDLFSIIDQVIRSEEDVAKAKEIAIITETIENPDVFADSEMVRTILRNLIVNAIKYSPRSGTVKVRSMQKAGFAEIIVEDSGTGISPEKAEALFTLRGAKSTPGTENEKGSGLGLLLCREFTEKHGGKISVISREGVGSVFSFTVPLQNKES